MFFKILWCLGQFYKDVINIEDFGQGHRSVLNFVVSILDIEIFNIYVV
jgi:hypothetical protein